MARRRAKGRGSWLPVLVCSLIVAGCQGDKNTDNAAMEPAVETSSPPARAEDGPLWRYNRSANALPVATSAQWGMLPKLTNGNTLAVGIIRGDGTKAIQVVCSENSKTLSMLVWPRSPSWESDTHRRLKLAFDSGGTISPAWFVSPVGFTLRDNEASFDVVMERISSQRRIMLIIEGGAEEERDQFPLVGAPQAVAQVLADCR